MEKIMVWKCMKKLKANDIKIILGWVQELHDLIQVGMRPWMYKFDLNKPWLWQPKSGVPK